MDYNTRYYSPYLNRFISPDSIIPEPKSSGGFNRYRYTRNNPVKFVDPSGHIGCEAGTRCPTTVPPVDSSTNESAANYFTGAAIALDSGAMILNGVSAGITDVATVIAGPPGYAFGIAVHNGVVSPIATGLDGLALLSTTTAGVFTGENAIDFELNEHGGSISIKVSQDTIVAGSLFGISSLIPEPNADALLSAGGVGYSIGRLPGPETGDPFIPTYINPTLDIEFEKGNPDVMRKLEEFRQNEEKNQR